MADTVFNLTIRENGALIDPPEIPRFEAKDNSYGILRVDTSGQIAPNYTPFSQKEPGVYTYKFPDPVSNLVYQYSLKLNYNGQTSYFVRRANAGTINLGILVPSYEYFSSEAEVVRLMGKFALDLILEDWNSYDQSAVWKDVLSYSDEIIHPYIAQHYDPTLLSRNAYIRRRATVLSAHQISQRRGNPSLYLREATRIYEELELVRAGRFHIPGGKPLGNYGPVVRNYVMQPHAYFPVRTQKAKSTGDSYGGEKLDWHPFLFTF